MADGMWIFKHLLLTVEVECPSILLCLFNVLLMLGGDFYWKYENLSYLELEGSLKGESEISHRLN
ncbi:hypothetical protein H5410_002355 [Solanum commersonii]|uniref:Uncharacterized protein n=1 Tax=Solanum commersonii TaxID=4109 RepID=A0A9J6B1N8_SOLCO|nr:hypothetical protein H5410_002355 [Solanum commersonii]